MSQDYPTTKPAVGRLPWKSINCKTHPAEYLAAVLHYGYEGNIEVDWAGQNNAIRKWYHVPWLHAGNKGREFIQPLPPAGLQTADARNQQTGSTSP